MSAYSGEVDTVQSKLIWEIKDFERVSNRNLLSPCWDITLESKKMDWNLVWLGDPTVGHKRLNNIVLFSKSNRDCCKITVDFAVLNINNEEVFKYKAEELYEENVSTNPLITLSMYVCDNFVTKDVINDQKLTLLDKGTLRIVCSITTNKYMQAEKRKNENEIEGFLRLEESKHLLNLLSSETFSDVIFSVEGKKLSANKSIIVNRSPVFNAMFKHDMVESKNNVIVVKDIPYSAMTDLLKFIYSGTVPVYKEDEQYESYTNLMIAADKYNISNLKAECERRLSNILKVDTVFDCLNLAETHSAPKLKEKAIDFIACNGHAIIESLVYKEFGSLYPEIASEVFRAVVKKINKVNK